MAEGFLSLVLELWIPITMLTILARLQEGSTLHKMTVLLQLATQVRCPAAFPSASDLEDKEVVKINHRHNHEMSALFCLGHVHYTELFGCISCSRHHGTINIILAHISLYIVIQ